MPASYWLDAELFTLKSFHPGPFLTHGTQSGSDTEEACMHNNEVPPKRPFLQDPHGAKSQTTAFFSSVGSRRTGFLELEEIF
jgi:hypothetical protein